MRSHRRLFIIVLGALLIVGALVACGESSNNTGTVTTISNATSAPSPHFKIGQQVKVGSTWLVTVNSAKTSTGSQYITPKSGNIYLIVTVSLKNVSSQEQNVSSIVNFSLTDSSGQKYNETIDPDAGSPPEGKVEANSPIKGSIVYEVPKTLQSYVFSFQSDFTSSGQTQWDITD